MIASNDNRAATGCKHWYRTSIDGPWVLECLQWYRPYPGIVKVVNRLDEDGALAYQQYYLDDPDLGTYSPVSITLDNLGSTVFTLERRRLRNKKTTIGAMFRYRRSDGSPICAMVANKCGFVVTYYDGQGNRTSTQRQKHIGNGEIEFFERNGRAITFESFTTELDAEGNIIQRSSAIRVWKHIKLPNGKEIVRKYKNGVFREDEYKEPIFEEVRFPLLLKQGGCSAAIS